MFHWVGKLYVSPLIPVMFVLTITTNSNALVTPDTLSTQHCPADDLQTNLRSTRSSSLAPPPHPPSRTPSHTLSLPRSLPLSPTYPTSTSPTTPSLPTTSPPLVTSHPSPPSSMHSRHPPPLSLPYPSLPTLPLLLFHLLLSPILLILVPSSSMIICLAGASLN